MILLLSVPRGSLLPEDTISPLPLDCTGSNNSNTWTTESTEETGFPKVWSFQPVLAVSGIGSLRSSKDLRILWSPHNYVMLADVRAGSVKLHAGCSGATLLCQLVSTN